MNTTPVKTFDLEMRRRPIKLLTAPSNKVTIQRLVNPAADYYLWLYESVGKDWRWVDRKVMSEEQLESIILDPRVEIYVLKNDKQEAGYVELDRRVGSEIEISYFGVFPEYSRQRLGTYFLNWALQRSWSYQPSRVWLHTCEWDHPAALPVYLRAGFQQIQERYVDQVVLSSQSTTANQ